MNILTSGPYYRPIILPTVVRERTWTERLTDWFAGENSYRGKVRRSLEGTLSHRYHTFRMRTPPLTVDGMTVCAFSYTLIDRVEYGELSEPRLIYKLNKVKDDRNSPYSVYITVISHQSAPVFDGLTPILWRPAGKAVGLKSYLDKQVPVILKSEIIKGIKEGKFK